MSRTMQLESEQSGMCLLVFSASPLITFFRVSRSLPSYRRLWLGALVFCEGPRSIAADSLDKVTPESLRSVAAIDSTTTIGSALDHSHQMRGTSTMTGYQCDTIRSTSTNLELRHDISPLFAPTIATVLPFANVYLLYNRCRMTIRMMCIVPLIC